MDITNTLLQVGLDPKEATVLQTLLHHAELPVTEIAKQSGLKRPTTYAILAALVQKGLVEQYEKRKIIFFRASHPLKLKEFLSAETAKIKTRESQLTAVLPELISQFNLTQHRPGLYFYEGVEGIKKVYVDTLKQPGEIFALVATEQPHPEIGRWVREVYVRQRVRRNIKAHVIASSATEAAAYQQLDAKELRETIIVPKEKFPFSIEIDMYGSSKTAFISYSSAELIGVILDSPAIYTTMKAFFDLAWSGQNDNKKNDQLTSKA